MAVDHQPRKNNTGRSVGAPQKPLYDPVTCPALVREMGRRGMSQAQMAMAFGVAIRAINHWAEKHPEFKDALEEANDFALAHWERLATRNIYNRDLNTPLFVKILSCRFRKHYGEKVQVGSDPDEPIITRVERVIIRPKNDGATNRDS